MSTPIVVDCHTHIFNAEDLPIDGFIKRQSPVPSLLTGVLSLPLDRLTQWAAPGSAEAATILGLLTGEPGLEAVVIEADLELPGGELLADEEILSDEELDQRLATLVPSAAAGGADAGLEAVGMTVDEAIAAALASATPEQLDELADWEKEWAEGLLDELDAGDIEGIGDLFRQARQLRRAAARFIATLRLVARHRYRIAAELAAVYPEVQLFVPALVDFSHTARDAPSTSVQEQVAIHSLVSKLAAAGGIPNGSHVRIHPLVGFSPHREVEASELAAWDVDAGRPNGYVPYADPATATADDRYTPDLIYRAARAKQLRRPTGPWASSRLDLRGVTRSLDIVRHAVELGGFAGVKLYPPAGFLPLGNVSRFGERVGGRLDAALRALYAYCVAEDVPILTHAARSNGFEEGFDDLAAPTSWQLVLDSYPTLRICFGHFGHLHGAGSDGSHPSPSSWVMRFVRLIDTHEHLYADVGNSRYVHDPGYREHFDGLLTGLLGAGSAPSDVQRKRRRRLMFGSDYWMNTFNPEHHQFFEVFSGGIEALVGAEARSWFMGANAMRWLGLTDDDDEAATGSRNRQRLIAFYGDEDRPSWLQG